MQQILDCEKLHVREFNESQNKTMPKQRSQLEREKAGRPGIDGILIIVDKVKGDDRPDEALINDTSERQFRVVGALNKFLPFSDDIRASVDEGEGQSYFLMPPTDEAAKIETSAGTYLCTKNERNELAEVHGHRNKLSGAQKLMEAVLYEAIQSCAGKPRSGGGSRKKVLIREAWEWIESDAAACLTI